MKGPAASCQGLVSVPHLHCTDTHTEARAQVAASHMALGYKLLSVTALHKNRASQFGGLMGILGGEAGDIAATVPAALLPASGSRPSSAKDNKQGPCSTGGSFRKLLLFPFARAT